MNGALEVHEKNPSQLYDYLSRLDDPASYTLHNNQDPLT